MTLDQIEVALGKHLAGMVGAPPIVWPNQDADPPRPFLFVQHVPGSRTMVGLSGLMRLSGLLIVTAVTEVGRFSTAANMLAQSVIDRFPYGLRLALGAGCVIITRVPEPLPAFRDGSDWRQPVRITYGAEPPH